VVGVDTDHTNEGKSGVFTTHSYNSFDNCTKREWSVTTPTTAVCYVPVEDVLAGKAQA